MSRLSVQEKILLLVVVPILVVVTPVLVYLLGTTQQYNQNRVQEQTAELAAQTTAGFEVALEQASQTAHSITRIVHWQQTLETEELRGILKEQVASQPFLIQSTVRFDSSGYKGFRSISVIAHRTPAKRGTAVKTPQPTPKSEVSASWWKRIRKDGRPFWTTPRYLKSSGIWTATYVEPLLDKGVVRGAAAIDVSLTELAARTNREGWTLIRLALLAPYTPAAILRSIPAQDPSADKAVDSALAVAASQSHKPVDVAPRAVSFGASEWIAVRPLRQSNWRLATVVEDTSVAFGRQQFVRAGIGLTAVLLLLLSFAWLVARSITRPIVQLQAAARGLEAGDLTKPIPAISGEEFGALGRTLASMANRIRERESDLLHQSDDLRRRVAQLDALFAMAHAMEKTQLPLPSLLQSAVKLVAPAWGPEACARLTIGSQVFDVGNVPPTAPSVRSVITVALREIGDLEVWRPMPQEEDGASEQRLLDDFARRIGLTLERREDQNDLRELNEELEERVRRRTRALHESETRLRSLFAATPDSVVIANDTGRVIYVNSHAEAAFGYDNNELIGIEAVQLLTDQSETRNPWFTGGSISSEMVRGDFMARRKDGSTFPVEIRRSVAVMEESGSRVVTCTLRDITERQRIEAFLRESERQYRTLVRNLPGVVYRCLVDSDWTMTFLSEPVLELTGYDAEEFLNGKRTFGSIIHPEDRERIAEEIAEALNKHSPFTVEYRVLDKAGKVRWVTDKGQGIFDEDGRVLYLDGTILEISKRKRVELALIESEEHYRRLFNTAGVGIITLRPNGSFVDVNDKFVDLVGYSRNELLVLNVLDVTHPDDVNTSRMHMARSMSGVGTADKFEKRYVRSDGREIWVEVAHMRVQPEGAPAFLVTTVVDITERRQALAALDDQLAFQIALIDTIPNPIYFKDPSGRFRGINRAFEAAFNVRREDVVGKMLMETENFAPEVRDFFQRQDLEVLQTRGRRHAEIEFPFADGRHHAILYWLTSFDFTDGRLGGMMGVIVDITELRRSEELFRAVYNASTDGLVVTGPEGEFLDCNAAAVQMFGMGHRSEIIGKRAEDVSPTRQPDGQDSREVLADIRQRQPNEGTLRYDWWFRKRNGKLFPVEVARTNIRIGNQALTLVVLHELTERMTVQRELEDARRVAESASRAKSEFLANMSHEIRTPMNAIIGMTHLSLQTDLTSKQRNYLEKIRNSSAALLVIINDILDFSKIEAGRLELEQAEFRLDDVIDNLAALLGLKAQEKGLEMLFDIQPDVPRFLVGDSLRLGQVLINLVGNAVKFTNSGEVVVAAHLVSRSGDNAELEFSVRDTGIGLTEAQISRLFTSFSQADGSTTRQYGGTGLGLAISRRLVEMMGGRIGVRSQPEEGSTFTFTIKVGLRDAAPELPDPEGDWGGKRVLVVDDNATSREIMRAMLERWSFHVEEAPDGAAGVAMVQQAQTTEQPFDLVLMDWRMPGLNGIEAARIIRGDVAKDPPPRIIIVTAYGREEVMQEAQEGGLNGFLVKPTTASALLDAIAHAFGTAFQPTFAPAAPVIASTSPAELNGRRFLVVEDNEVNQEVLRDLLTSVGAAVVTAGDGQQALDIIERQNFDVVLMDVQMPVMDGYEATRRLRAMPRFESLPIIAVTANAMAPDRQRALDAGMNDHIAKPINVSELFSVLARWCNTPLDHDKIPALPAPQQPEAPGTGGDMAEQTLAALESIGADVEMALDRLNGNRQVLSRAALRFADEQIGVVDRIREALDQNDREVAVRLVHTLKGLAGTLGARSVFEAARTAEHALREDIGNVNALLGDVETHLTPVLQALEQVRANLVLTQGEDVAEGSEMDREELQRQLGELRDKLRAYDTTARAQWEQLRPVLERTVVRQQVDNAIYAYDYDRAVEVVTDLMDTLVA